jgi:spermidine synthase
VIARFEELDWQPTRMGDLTLRRRTEPATGELIYEVKLGDEYLMSSLFTVAEEELAVHGLAAAVGSGLDVLVGGLGLGYTAVAALGDDRVRSLVHDDFFALMRRPPASPSGDYDVILLDVDHSPRHQLDPTHADLYTAAGLEALDRHLRAAGVFALWSDDPPDEEFIQTLGAVFDSPAAHVVGFANPLTGGTSANTVYVGVTRRA